MDMKRKALFYEALVNGLIHNAPRALIVEIIVLSAVEGEGLSRCAFMWFTSLLSALYKRRLVLGDLSSFIKNKKSAVHVILHRYVCNS